jgi:hypothetical protein
VLAPILTDALAHRIDAALANAAAARLVGTQQVAGNPLGVEVRHFGSVTAYLVRRDVAYYPYYSRPRLLRADDAAVVPELVAWYRANGRPCYVSLSPFAADENLLRTLAGAGLHQSGFRTVLHATPDAAAAPAVPGIVVQVVQVPGLGPFLSVWTADAPLAEQTLLRTLAQAEFARWRCYVAFIEEQPAACAGLYLDADTGVGVLAAATTLPDYQRRGCQLALLRQRLTDAASAGYDLVVSQASPGSSSQRNMERVGLRTAYTEVTWIPLAW